MSKATNLPAETEELSRLLDEMNCRQQPRSENPETMELLAVAELLKKTGLPANPPQQIINQTVNQIIAATDNRKTKHRSAWLYSGVLGTAAAVLLVIGLNISTLWSPQEPTAALPPLSSPLLQEPAPEIPAKSQPQEPPASEAPAKTTPQTGAASPTAPAEKPAVTEKAAPAPSQSPAAIGKSEPPIAMRALVTQDQPPAEKQQAPISSKKSSISLTQLFLPDKKPDTVITDNENGTIRQIYAVGTPQEFTITQQALTAGDKNAVSKDSSVSVAKTDKTSEKADNHNKVTIRLYDQEITIEGPQPKQELLDLVQSLVP
jgi:outer membrane biosynthesis protein TonB